jgi:hypothetical protein
MLLGRKQKNFAARAAKKARPLALAFSPDQKGVCIEFGGRVKGSAAHLGLCKSGLQSIDWDK